MTSLRSLIPYINEAAIKKLGHYSVNISFLSRYSPEIDAGWRTLSYLIICACVVHNNGIIATLMREQNLMRAGDEKVMFNEYIVALLNIYSTFI